MSSRCSIVCSGPLHIFEETNSWDDKGRFEICICNSIDQSLKCKYNGDYLISRKYLFEVYQDLKKYFEEPDWRGEMRDRE